MIKLFLDIETIPADESVKAGLESHIRPPKNLSRPETLVRWETEAKPERVEDTFRKTALRGHQGRILCVGYIKERERGLTEDVITGLEPSILRYFWDLASDVDLFVGFNILNFDLRFIVQRSIIHGIRPTKRLPFSRYRSEPIYDVMQEWECWGRENIGLGDLAEALDLQSPKGELDGSKVYDYYRDGRLEEVYRYCMEDVRTTRAIYRKMTFQD